MSYFNSNDNICQSKNVQAFFDDELDSEKKLLVEQHLSECAACNHELKAIRSLQLLVRMALSGGSQISIAPVAYPQKDHQLNVKR
jgi:anti-sigma factor RsiW